MKVLNLYCLFVAALIATSFSGCTKGDDIPATVTTGSVNVINATDNFINFYINGTRQNSTAGMPLLGSSGYTAVPTGGQVLSFKGSFNNQDFTNTDTLFTLPVNLVESKAYSLFVAGKTRSTAILLKDTLVAGTDAKMAQVRFVHASAGSPALRVVMNDTTQFNNASFKSATAFKSIGVGIKTIQIFTLTGTTPIISKRFTLAPRTNYTLFVRGNITTTGDAAFSEGLMAN